MKVILALNRATSRRWGAMSRRSREESSQRRDVQANVATFQREVKINVATLRTNIVTFQRKTKTNVAMLRVNAATLQRRAKLTS